MTDINEAIADRAALGARIAEVMGWRDVATGRPMYADKGGGWWLPEAIVSWAGYGVVDAWMREQGYSRLVWRYPYSVEVSYWKPGQNMLDNMVTLETPDEPLAAALSMEKALEARDDTND